MNNGLFYLLFCFLINNCGFSQGSKTYAVVVGISDYKSLNYTNGDLRYADKDAQKFVSFLKSKQGGAIFTTDMVVLLNEDATKENIIKSLLSFEKAKSNDKIWFYFSGHGIVDGLVPYDAAANHYSTILTYTEIKKAFKASLASTKICIADACHTGSMQPKSNKSNNTNTKNDNFNMNIAMILSSRSSQNAVENFAARGGVFTYFLLKGLYGYADFDKNKSITIKELFQYVSPKVKKNTPNRQSPVFIGKFSDSLVMSQF